MYKCFSSGLLGSNTYVVYDEASRECLVVDAGNPVSAVSSFIEDMGLTVKYIVLTHAHYDHADFVGQYKAKFDGAVVVVHEDEVKVMTDSEANVSVYFGMPKSYGYPDKTVKEGDTLTIGESKYRVLHTPGHTPGSICLYNSAERLMLTGDTLFRYGRGRCDFKYGSEADIELSLRRLLSMSADIVFLSGHGMPSTIGAECGGIW